MEQQGAYLDLTILSASDLKRGWLSGDQTVAIAWVDPALKKSTGVTSGGGFNAQWHEKLTVPLNDADVIARHGKWLTIEIRSKSALGGDNLLGTANVTLAELALDTQKEANNIQTYQLVLPSGKRYGSVSFVGKIVKSRASSSSATSPSAPPVSLSHAYDGGPQSNVLYPPVSYSSDETYRVEKPPTSCGLASHLPQVYPPVSYSSDETYRVEKPHTSCGLTSHLPQVYPPVNASYPPHVSPASCAPWSCVEGVAPYSPQFSSAPYPPPTSMYQHSTPPVPYPPRFVYPSTAPHYLETPYPPPTHLYPYATHSSPVYPPPYPPQHAPPSFCDPHPAF